MNQRFQGLTALITGVNDRGIGGAIAERLADEGANLALLWYEEPKRLLRRLHKRNTQVVSVNCDVTDSTSVDRAVLAACESLGPINVLVNNAGVDHSAGLSETSDEDWQALLDVNLTGAMRMTRRCLPELADESGVIINIASVLGIAGCSGFPAYSATKAGLIGLTQSLAMELAPRGIRATCVAPALVHTPMSHKYLADAAEKSEDDLKASHPLGIGTPHDVAAAVAFLASPEARWITGITLPLGWAASFPLPMQELNSTENSQPSALKITDWQDIQSFSEGEDSTERRAAS